MRFKGVRDSEGLGTRLKDLRIGDSRIFIKIALFQKPKIRDVQIKPSKVGQKDPNPSTKWKVVAPCPLRGNRSYTEAMPDVPLNPGKGERADRTKRIIVDEVKAEETKWLQGCAVRSLKSVDFLPDLPFLLTEAGFIVTRAKYIGSFHYLLECDFAIELAKMLHEGKEVLLQWFECIKP